ncbi:MAG: hypothetical protein PHD60_04925, partial [Clostridia bacterium]|nr:hypothetical protein [Clostridia bacterium]
IMNAINKRCSICLVLVFVLAISCITVPVCAMEVVEKDTEVEIVDDGIFTLDEVKERVQSNARMLKSLEMNEEVLEQQTDMAHDAYYGTDIQSTINGYKKRLKEIADEYDKLESNDERKAQLEADMMRIEMNVGRLIDVKASLKETTANLKNVWRSLQNNYDDMEKVKSDTENKLDFNAEVLYFAILDLDRTIEMQERNRNVQETQLGIVRLKLQLGMSSEVDEQNVIVQYENVHKSIKSLKDQRMFMAWKLNDLMGRPSNATLDLEEVAITLFPINMQYEKLVEKSLANSLAIRQKEREIEDLKDDYHDENNRRQRGVYLSQIDSVEVSLESLEEAVRQGSKSVINDIQNNYRQWENSVTAKEKAEKDYKNSKIYYELGMIAKIQLLQSELGYLQAVDAESKAKESWYMARCKLELVAEGIIEG